MSEWRSLVDDPPKRRQLCDFLISGDYVEPRIWMLCHADLRDLNDYLEDERLTLWRPAAPLPEGVTEFDGALMGRSGDSDTS